MHLSNPAEDIWVQAKAHQADWTLSALLQDELLGLFVQNALLSERRGKSWQVSLATTSEVRGAAIRKFLKRPSQQRRSYLLFKACVEKAWRSWGDFSGSRDVGVDPDTPIQRSHVRAVALKCLEQLADVRQAPFESLIRDIELVLTRILVDSNAVARVATAISGALLEGIREDHRPVPITLRWLEDATGHDLRPKDLLSTDVRQACAAQIEELRLSKWSSASCASRPRLAQAVREFVDGPSTVFVLTGESGSGKSWFCTQQLSEEHLHVRALVSGTALVGADSLRSVIGAAFRNVARLHATDEEIWRRLIGTVTGGRNPFLIVIDDVPVSADPAALTDKLSNLFQEAEHAGVKLILTVRPRTWQRLWDSRFAPYLFRQRSIENEARQKQIESYRLGGFEDAELIDALERNLPRAILAKRAARYLREPRLAAVRNPYLLSLFIHNEASKVRLTSSSFDADPDALLDFEAERRFEKVAQRANCDPLEIKGIVDDLVECMWRNRATGAPFAELRELVDRKIPQLGPAVINALQSEDIVTQSESRQSPGGNVVYANPQLGDRLTAVWLFKRLLEGKDIQEALDPTLDDNLVVTIVRGMPSEVDCRAWINSALRRDSIWLGPLAEGLAQRGDDDWNTLAILTSWANLDVRFATWNAMRALGGMVGRSSRARQWISLLYSDEHWQSRYKGEIALARSLEIAPKWVERRIRVRLRRDIRRSIGSFRDNRKKAEFIRGALGPLRHVSSRTVAVVADSILEWLQRHYVPVWPENGADVRESVTDTIDYIRGRVAVFGSDNARSRILQELDNPQSQTRLRAARSLVPLADQRSDAALTHILERLSVETSPQILVHLARSCFPYTDRHSDRIIDVLSTPEVQRSLGKSGSMVSLLAEMATSSPTRVAKALMELPSASPDTLTLNRELLVLAWWRCSAAPPCAPEAVRVLNQLATVNYEGTDPSLRPFAARAAAVATLALIGLEVPKIANAGSSAVVYYNPLGLETGWDFFHVEIAPILSDTASSIAGHPLAATLTSQLIETLQEYRAHEAHPIKTMLYQWQFRLAHDTADALSAVALQAGDRFQAIKALDDHWPTLRVLANVIRAGEVSQELIARALDLCGRHRREVAGNNVAERDRLISELLSKGLLGPQSSDWAPKGETFSAQADASAAETLAETDPSTVLDQLHAAVTVRNATSFLWEWSTTSQSPECVLLGSIHRLCFREAQLSALCCLRCCEAMIDLGKRATDNDLSRQNISIFRLLAQLAGGKTVEVPELAFQNDFLSQSHKSAAMLISAFVEDPKTITPRMLSDFISSSVGWVEDMSQWIEDGNVAFGSGHGAATVYFPPALRFALAIVGEASGFGDFGCLWIQERAAVRQVIVESVPNEQIRQAMRERELNKQEKELLRPGLEKLDAQIVLTPNHSDLYQAKGHLLLLRGSFDGARDAFSECLDRKPYSPYVRSNAHYDLACVYARQNRPEQCQAHLIQATRQGVRITRASVQTDPDLESVKTQDWFQALLRTLPE